MLRTAASLITLLVASLAIAQDIPVVQPKAGPIPYKRGQVWKYTGRWEVPDSTITILEVESRPKGGTIVHIRVDGLPGQSCGSVHLKNSIEHLAVTEKTLRKSTTDMVKENVDLPDDYFAAYREWQQQKKPRVLKEPLAELVRAQNVPGALICNWQPATRVRQVSPPAFFP